MPPIPFFDLLQLSLWIVFSSFAVKASFFASEIGSIQNLQSIRSRWIWMCLGSLQSKLQRNNRYGPGISLTVGIGPNQTELHDGDSGHSLQMSVFEERGIFQAEAQHSIEADMRRPDECEGHRFRSMQPQSQASQNKRKYLRVTEIVETRPEPHAHQISDHQKIRPQKKNYKPNPTGSYKVIKEQA
jgi:hypothetical protein